MSRHVWLTKRFQPQTVKTGLKAYQYALNHGASVELACYFAGYILETEQQQGSFSGYRAIRWRSATLAEVPHSIAGLFAAAKERGFRFAKGRNVDGYLRAGLQVLYQTLEHVLPLGSEGRQLLDAFRDRVDCWFALHDWLEDRGMTEEAALFRPDPSP